MLPRTFFSCLSLVSGWVGFAGCRGEAARSPHATRAQMNSGATVAINEAGHIPRKATHSRPLREIRPTNPSCPTYKQSGRGYFVSLPPGTIPLKKAT